MSWLVPLSDWHLVTKRVAKVATEDSNQILLLQLSSIQCAMCHAETMAKMYFIVFCYLYYIMALWEFKKMLIRSLKIKVAKWNLIEENQISV